MAKMDCFRCRLQNARRACMNVCITRSADLSSFFTTGARMRPSFIIKSFGYVTCVSPRVPSDTQRVFPPVHIYSRVATAINCSRAHRALPFGQRICEISVFCLLVAGRPNSPPRPNLSRVAQWKLWNAPHSSLTPLGTKVEQIVAWSDLWIACVKNHASDLEAKYCRAYFCNLQQQGYFWCSNFISKFFSACVTNCHWIAAWEKTVEIIFYLWLFHKRTHFFRSLFRVKFREAKTSNWGTCIIIRAIPISISQTCSHRRENHKANVCKMLPQTSIQQKQSSQANAKLFNPFLLLSSLET